MAERLSAEDFSKHLHTKFRVRAEGPLEVELELAEVAGYRGGASEAAGMERFSLFFEGPSNVFLQQGVYALDHAQLGEQILLLVPVGRSEGRFRYEAVFNYFKEE